MRVVSLFTILLLASCVSNDPPALTVEALLQDRTTYNNQSVQVCGILVDSVEYCGLENDVPKDVGFVDSLGRKMLVVEHFIWVNAGHDLCMPGKVHPMSSGRSESWAIIEGQFMTGAKYGHLGGLEHQIVATSIQLVQKSCRPSDRSGT